jgi:hypothetical protein
MSMEIVNIESDSELIVQTVDPDIAPIEASGEIGDFKNRITSTSYEFEETTQSSSYVIASSKSY